MTERETLQVITLLAGNYKSVADRVLGEANKENLRIMTKCWYECLNDLDYKLVLTSVKKAMITSSYAPTIHDIRKNCITLLNPVQDRTPIEAWNEAISMISNGIYMTQEQFDAHSEDVKAFFGSPNRVKECAMMESTVVNSVIQSNFLKQYEVLRQRQIERKMLPESMQDFTKQLAEKMSIKQIGGNQ